MVRELIATDTDENADLDFRLDPIPSQLSLTAPFRMENNELVLKHSLDREQVDQYNLVCIVTDLNAADGVEQVDRGKFSHLDTRFPNVWICNFSNKPAVLSI